MIESMSRRGAVAALLLALGAPLGAQVTGIIQVRPQEPRDSTEFRAMMMTKQRLDSIATLMREFNKLPPGSQEWQLLKTKIDALMPARMPTRVVVRSNGGPPLAFPKGWIGINAQGPVFEDIGPNGYFVQYFDYPAIISVDPESPAQRAGIVPGDVLIGYDGVDVRGHRFDLTQMLVPDKKLSVSVRHDGETKDYTVTVAPVPAQVVERRLTMTATELRAARGGAAGDAARGMVMDVPRRPVGAGGGMRATSGSGAGARAGAVIPFTRSYVITANGAFGAVMSTVNSELAKTLKLETGVLVTDITDETPASRSGLRPGDVIVNAAGQPVSSLKALQELLLMTTRAGERSVALQVVRDKRPQKVTVSW